MAKSAAFRKRNANQNTVPLYLGEVAALSIPSADPDRAATIQTSATATTVGSSFIPSGYNTPRATDGSNGGPNQGGRRSPPGEGRAANGGVADDDDERLDGCGIGAGVAGRSEPEDDSQLGDDDDDEGLALGSLTAVEPGPLRIEGATLGPTSLVRGQWAGADWIFCRDGKYRPVEPGTFPLATRYPNRVGALRGYGNALCAPVAQGFIEAVMDVLDDVGG